MVLVDYRDGRFVITIDIFPNAQNLQVSWQNAADILIANIKAQCRNFSWGFGNTTHSFTEHKSFTNRHLRNKYNVFIFSTAVWATSG